MRYPQAIFAAHVASAAAFIALLPSCGRTTKPPPAPIVATAPPQPLELVEPRDDSAPPTEVAIPAESPVATKVEVPPEPPPIPTEKLLLCSPRGPLVVEFEIWIDGQPQARVFDQLLDEVLKLADTDGDGRPQWKEVTTSPKFKYGQFGNLPIDRENAPKQIIQQYDQNGNGLVDRGELPRFLTRNAGGARAFSVRSLEQFHGRNRRGSPAWRAVDADNDGYLTATELQQAFAQLKLHDADDDEVLLIDELRPTADIDPGSNMRTRGQLGDFARLLGEHANWDSIRTALEQQYALGGNLGPDDFLLMGEVFQQMDLDRDGKLLRKEFPELNKVAPHLRFRIDFGRTDAEPADKEEAKPQEDAQPAPTVRLLSSRLTAEQTGGAAPQISELPGRVVLRWPGVSLTFVRNDTIAAIDYEMQAQQGLTMYDANANGYLEDKEVNQMVQTQFARFEALDSDSDGKVYAGEIAAFLRQRQGAQRAQVHTRAQDQEDSLFLALDQNSDDRLDARELETAAERLKKLDADADGKISGDELPAELAIVVARGSVENPNQLFAISPVEAQAPQGDLPGWFTAMDASRDGVISAREFLGTAEKFATLDKNQNGFFEPSEIPEQSTAAPATERNDP